MRNRTAINQEYILILKNNVKKIVDSNLYADRVTANMLAKELTTIIQAYQNNLFACYGRMLESINSYRRRRYLADGTIHRALKELLITELSTQEEAEWQSKNEPETERLEPVTLAILRVRDAAKKINIANQKLVLAGHRDVETHESFKSQRLKQVLKTAAYAIAVATVFVIAAVAALIIWQVTLPLMIGGIACAAAIGSLFGLMFKESVEDMQSNLNKNRQPVVTAAKTNPTQDIYKKFKPAAEKKQNPITAESSIIVSKDKSADGAIVSPTPQRIKMK